MGFMEIIELLKTCKYGFNEIYSALADFYDKVCIDANITGITDVIWKYLNYIEPALPFILIGIYVIIALTGKRIMAPLRFVAFFVLGFFLGVYSLSPIMLEVMPAVPTWVTGLVTGVVAAVLAKFIYFILLGAVMAYSTYMVCYLGLLPWVGGFMAENWIIGVVVAILATVALFFVLKYFEMAGTAMLGGYGIAVVVGRMCDYGAISAFEGKEWIMVLIITLSVALIGLFVQFKTRKRYN